MLILASKSPRRKELMSLLGIPFEIHQKNVDETLAHPLSPEETVRFLSAKKAEAVATEHPFDLVLGVDTLVFAQGQILGKPKDSKDAQRMLRLLSGKIHTVFSGFTILGMDKAYSETVSTKVQFAPLSEKEIDLYIASGEPMDKAGAYGIQGKASRFISGIEGDYYSVVGLPLYAIYRALKENFHFDFGGNKS